MVYVTVNLIMILLKLYYYIEQINKKNIDEIKEDNNYKSFILKILNKK